MASMATTLPRWASPCGKDVSSRRTIRAGHRGSASWTRTSRGTTGRTLERYWPTIVGRLRSGKRDAEAFTVVGVVGEVKQAGLTEDQAQGAIYYPYAFHFGDSVFVAVRTSLPPESLALTLQKVVRQIDADVPVNDLRSMDTRIADSLVARRSPALLAGLFSGIALLLTAIGTYGVLSYAVAQRRRGDRRAHGLGRATSADSRPVFFSLFTFVRRRNAVGLDRSMAGGPRDADGALPRSSS